MAEKGLSASDVEGSGKRGQVLKGDVIDAIAKGTSAPAQAKAPAAPRPASSADDASREERVRMTKLRQTIARRLKDAQDTAAMLTTFNEVDMSAVMSLRSKYKDIFEKKHGVKLGFMGFFTKAITHALKEIPAVNAEIDGTDIIYKNYAHVGMAVGTDKASWCRSSVTPTRCRSRKSRRNSGVWRRPRATASSPWPTCRAAPSRSPTAASTAR